MADINDLLIRIDATTEQLRREMNRAENAVHNGGRRIDARLSRIDRSFSRMGRAAATAGAAVAAVFASRVVRQANRLVTSAVQSAAAVGELADIAGIGAEQLQELQFAFGRLAGVTDRETAEAFRRFNRRIGLAAEGSGAAANAVRELGIATVYVDGSMRDTGEILDEALQKLSRVEGASRRAAMASQLFGDDAGPKLAAALAQGEQAVDGMRGAAREMGIVLSDEMVEDARRLNDLMGDIRRQFDAELTKAVLDNATAFETWAINIGRAASAVTNFVGRHLARVQELDRARRTGSYWGTDGVLQQIEVQPRRRLRDVPQPAPMVTSIDPADARAAQTILRGTMTELERIQAEIAEAQRLADKGLFGDDADRVLRAMNERLREAQLEVSGFNDATRAAVGHFEATRTAAERLEEQIDDVRILLDGGIFDRMGIDGTQVLERLEEQLADLDSSIVETVERTNRAAVDMGFAFSSAFEDAILQGGKLRDVLQGLAQDIARIALRTAITAPLGSAIGEGLGNILPFARGGVVDRPTFFPMSGNRTGVAGEAGPEGILPLKRMPGGDLGVQADGGRSTTVNIHIDAPGADQRTLELVREVARQEIVPQAIKGAMSATVNVLQRPAFS